MAMVTTGKAQEQYPQRRFARFPLVDDELDRRNAHDAPTVLYIGGCGRSGSTLLARMLGQVPSVANVGEMRDLWLKGCIQNRLCGCGARFRNCAFWSRVGLEAFGGWEQVNPEEMIRLRAALDRPWLFPLLAARGGRAFEARVASYTQVLDRLYRAIRTTAEANVIVDASKFATFSLLLRRAGMDVRLVHVVRDSRGVAYSWRKEIQVPDSPDKPIFMPRYSPAAAAALYAAYNVQTELLRLRRMPYMLLRYEDLVADPGLAVRLVLGHAGLAADRSELSFLGDRNVRLGVDHTVMGNPVRMKLGNVEVTRDDGEVLGLNRAFVSAITFPLLVRYGYLPPRQGKARPRPDLEPASAPAGTGSGAG